MQRTSKDHSLHLSIIFLSCRSWKVQSNLFLKVCSLHYPYPVLQVGLIKMVGKIITILLNITFHKTLWALIVWNACLDLIFLKMSLIFPFQGKQQCYDPKKKIRQCCQKRCVPLYEPWSNGSARSICRSLLLTVKTFCTDWLWTKASFSLSSWHQDNIIFEPLIWLIHLSSRTFRHLCHKMKMKYFISLNTTAWHAVVKIQWISNQFYSYWNT